MYLDTHERDRVRCVVWSLHARWFLRALERIGARHGLRLLLLTILYVSGLALLAWLHPAEGLGVPILALCATFIALLQLSTFRYRKNVREQIERNTPERWFQELEQAEVGSDDRQLFLRLLDASQEGSAEDLRDLLAEATRSSVLSRLMVLRELRPWM